MGAVSCCKKSSLLVLAIVSVVVIIYYPPDLYGLVVNEDAESDDINHLKRKVGTDHTVSSGTTKPSLPQDVIDGVEKFVFFVGYPRSGHSIIGSFLDAHPNMVIAHEFMLLRKWRQFNLKKTGHNKLQNKTYLFNALYQSSVHNSDTGWRSRDRDSKNYTLNVDSPWMGKYDRHISVIGDKSGGMTTLAYIDSPGNFTLHYKQLKETVGVPIKVLYGVRNPFDLVSTSALYDVGRKTRNTTQEKFVSSFKADMGKLRNEEFKKARFDNEKALERNLNLIKSLASAIMKLTDLIGPSNVLELHNSELVSDPNSTLTKICAFLEVDCSPDYLQACSGKVFNSVSKSRELVVWPKRLQSMVEDMIKSYPFFKRYSFTSE